MMTKLRGYIPSIVLASATVFFIYDIASDLLADDDAGAHILIESVVFVAVAIALFLEIQRITRLQEEIRLSQSRTARLSGELLTAIKAQFVEWGLSPSESDVALLLIKGLSMKEISAARQVKEKTTRQQATSIYAKSGCAGRHELVAGFIEDLLNYSQDAHIHEDP